MLEFLVMDEWSKRDIKVKPAMFAPLQMPFMEDVISVDLTLSTLFLKVSSLLVYLQSYQILPSKEAQKILKNAIKRKHLTKRQHLEALMLHFIWGDDKHWMSEPLFKSGKKRTYHEHSSTRKCLYLRKKNRLKTLLNVFVVGVLSSFRNRGDGADL